MDHEGPGEGTGLPRRRLSPWIALLFLAITVMILGGLITSYIGVTQSPGQDMPDLQPRIDQAHTAEARFITESASINITETVAAAIATARPFTETAYAASVTAYAPISEATQTAYAPTLEAYLTAYIATQTAYAPTGEAYQTAYVATQTAYAPTREVVQTANASTSEAFQTAYASTARAKGTTTVEPLQVVEINLLSGSFSPPSSADLARREAEALDKGRYLFNAPSEMITGDKHRVELRIVRDTRADSYPMRSSLFAFAAGLQSTGTPQIESMQVGKLMKAKLTASDFAITPLNEEEQIILGQNYTQWAWDVSPQRAGDLDLNLTISIKVVFQGEEGLYDHPVITKRIFVKVNPSYSFRAFASNNWQWLMGTIILPILAWLWKKMRDQETGGKKKPGSPKKTKKKSAD